MVAGAEFPQDPTTGFLYKTVTEQEIAPSNTRIIMKIISIFLFHFCALTAKISSVLKSE